MVRALPRASLFPYTTLFRSLRIALEGHGRETIFDDLDLSRTVGWFTTLFPVVLERGQAAQPESLLASIKAQLRRSEEHTSELQSQSNLVCRLLLEKKNECKL